MHISIKHGDKSFDVSLHKKEGDEPFLTIKRCRVVNSSKGEFVSFPAVKLETGNWLNMVYGSQEFQQAIMDRAKQ